jgi:DNA repair protein RAD50
MRSKDKQLEQLIQDYATDYADAKQKYKETLAKVQVGFLLHDQITRLTLRKTMTGATNDLAKYGAALDK